MYNFKFELSEDDYLEFNKYHVYNTPNLKKNIIIMRFFTPMCVVLTLFILLNSGKLDYPPVLTYTISGIFSFVWILFFKKINDTLMKKQLLKLKKSGKLPYQTETTLCFEELEVIEYTETGEMKIKYSALERTAVDRKAIYLYFSAIQAFIIPLTVFESNEEQKTFLDFINKKMTVL